MRQISVPTTAILIVPKSDKERGVVASTTSATMYFGNEFGATTGSNGFPVPTSFFSFRLAAHTDLWAIDTAGGTLSLHVYDIN